MIERVLGTILALFGVAGSILASTAEQGGSLVYGGGLAVVALAGVSLVFQSLRKDLKAVRGQLRACEDKHDLMSWRFEIVLGILRHAGHEVPAEVWAEKPPAPPM